MKVKKYVRLAAGAALVVFLAAQAQASGGSMGGSEGMLQELKRMIEQQQAQLDRAGGRNRSLEGAACRQQRGNQHQG